MNRYDVIYLDMTGVIGEAGAADIVPYMKRNIICELAAAYPGLAVEEGFVPTLVNAVSLAGSRFIVIIDEWDAPIREAGSNPRAQRDYLEFLRMLFKNSGATSRVIAAAYMTGILPIKKDGSQSAMSDFQEFTILDPGKHAVFTGFTEAEVRTLCGKYHRSFEEAKSWYDGYTFDESHSIYNPYSIMCAMQSGKFKSYWKKTSAAEALLTYIDMDEDGLQGEIARLVSGEEIEADTEGFENDFETFKDKDDVLTLLIHLGYLAYVEDKQGTGTVRILNQEVRMEFHRILRKGKHKELIRLIRESDCLLEKTIQGDADAVANAVAKIHDSMYAPQFYNNEQALRAAVRYAYITCVGQYARIEELPSGHGCADIVYIPKWRAALPAMLIELKWNKTAAGAIAQIRDRDYPAVLQGIGQGLLLVGINYNEKTKVHSCVIERDV